MTDEKNTDSQTPEATDAAAEGLSETTDTQETQLTEEQTLEQQVSEYAGKVERKDGKLVLPDGLSPEMAFAVRQEVRRRDTQSELTKNQARVKVLEAKTKDIQALLEKKGEALLTEEQRGELETLKDSGDLETWRKKTNEYIQAALAEITDTGTVSLKQQMELDLAEYNADEANKDFQLSESVLENDIPPRITKKFSDNQVTFKEYLAEAGAYLRKSKVVGDGQKSQNTPDLGTAPGDSKPPTSAVQNTSNKEYTEAVF